MRAARGRSLSGNRQSVIVKKLLVFLVLTGGALSGAYYWFQQRGKGSKDVAYSTVPVDHGRLTETISATGVVQPRQVYVVGTELAGKVTEVLADFNQEVEEGAVLLRLDDRAARQRLAEAQAAVDVAEAGVRQAEGVRDSALTLLEREKSRDPLVRREIEIKILENQVRSAHLAIESAQFKVKQAQQAVAQAELGLKLTVVRAPVLRPVDGSSAAEVRPGVGGLSEELNNGERRKFLVLERRVSLNQMIGPPLSGHLFTLAGDLSVMHVEAQVAEGDFPRVSRGLPVEFTIPGAGDEDPVFHGKVEDVRLMPVNDRGAIFYKIIIEVRNDRDQATGRWKLTPGQTATVEVLRRTHERVWKMPATALNFQPDDAQITPAARDRLEKWDARKDREDWRTVWVVGGDNKPWPLFVRTGGVGPKGETGIRDLSFSEVLEWDPELAQKPDPANPTTWPEVIIAAQAVKGGLFSQPAIKF